MDYLDIVKGNTLLRQEPLTADIISFAKLSVIIILGRNLHFEILNTYYQYDQKKYL